MCIPSELHQVVGSHIQRYKCNLSSTKNGNSLPTGSPVVDSGFEAPSNQLIHQFTTEGSLTVPLNQLSWMKQVPGATGLCPLAILRRCSQRAQTTAPRNQQTHNFTQLWPHKKQKGLGSLVQTGNGIKEGNLPSWASGTQRRKWKPRGEKSN